MAIYKDRTYVLPFTFLQVDLITPFNPQYLLSPVEGWIEEMAFVVQVAIGAAAGTIKVTLGAVDVVGLTATTAISAAVGTAYSVSIKEHVATAKVLKYGVIHLIPSGFITSGVVQGWLRITGGK